MLLQGTYFDFLKLSLSKADRPFVKTLLFLSEKMARCLQQSIYLKNLKKQGHYPTTIQNMKLPSFFNNVSMAGSANFIKTYVLNKTIRYVNSQAAISKNRLSVHVVGLFDTFSEGKAISICAVIEQAFQRSSGHHETRLLQKMRFAEEKRSSPPTRITSEENLKLTVTDLTKTLNNDELNLLAKGPKFAVTGRLDEMEVRASFSQLAYRLRWQAQIASSKVDADKPPPVLPKYPVNDYISQPLCNDRELEVKLKTCYAKIMEITHRVNKRQPCDNISNSEKRTLKLLRDKDYSFLPSDKGTEFCVVENSRYDEAAFKHLSDTSIYKPVAHMTPKTIEKKINQTWKTICNESKIAMTITKSYVSSNTTLPRFYHLIKTHKSGPELKIRPIVSNKGGPSAKLSWLLSRLMKPLLSQMPTHLEDSPQLMKAIEAMPTTERKRFSYPFSLDVVSLYTSVPPEDAIQALEDLLEANPVTTTPFTPSQVSRLLTSIMKNTYFQYKDQVYHQVSGLPMGNNISGILAMVFMARLENQIVDNLNIGLYKRYVDDVLILTTNREEADHISNAMNKLNKHIRFETEHPNCYNATASISLLDFCVSIDKEGNPRFCFYRKPAKKNTFPHATSALPCQAKKAAITNEMERIARTCTSTEDKKRQQSIFLNDLTARGYTKTTTRTRRQKTTTAKPSELCYFELPFINDHTYHAIKKVFTAAQLPVRLYSKNRNLRSLLSRSRVAKTCTVRNCPLNEPKLCCTSGCVYEMRCLKCSQTYIGSTIRQLHTRIKEHLQRDSSSIFRHQEKCKTTFDVKVIARDRHPNRLRFKEAVCIQRQNPSINSKFEREELLHLIF